MRRGAPALLTAALWGAGASAQSVTVPHLMGQTTLARTPQRIVVLEFGFMDALAKLGVRPVGIAADGDKADVVLPHLKKYYPAGSVTLVGNFETNHVFTSDLAWVHGHGLYITLDTNGTIDLYRIDPATASTLADVHGGYDNIQGLSGYHDQLWAVSKGGFVYQADLATGALTQAMMDGPEYTEAAE